MRIVTDFDGTLMSILYMLRRLLDDPEDMLVITGQTALRNDMTRKTLDACGLKDVELRCYPPYDNADFDTARLDSIIEWKAKQVKFFGADTFFNDDLRVIMGVRKENPNVVCCLVM